MKFLKNNFFSKNKIVFLIIVRMGSKRLSNKAKLKINNYSLIEILLKRLLKNFPKEQIFICTSVKNNGLYLKRISEKYKINFFEGSDKNVFKRIIDLRKKYDFDHFVRITGDNPFTDPQAINKMIKAHLKRKSEYTSTSSLPVGTAAEIISYAALKKANDLAVDRNSSEYLAYYFKRALFKRCRVKLKKIFNFQNDLHITIDTKDDLSLTRKLLKNQSIFINNYKLIKLMSVNKMLYLKKKSPPPKVKTNQYNVSFKKNIYNKIIM